MKKDSVRFAYTGVEIKQFAMLDLVNDNSGAINMSASANVNYDDRAIGIGLNLQFISSDKPFLVIDTLSHFVIEEQCWNELSNNKTEDVILPKRFLEHLNALAIGTTRGVLIGKTDGTEYSKYFLPLVDATELGCVDLVVKRNNNE